MESKLTFNELVACIQEVHEQFAAQASKAVNVSLTLRNWAIGCYLREYEQRGSDRATYGKLIVERLADELQSSLDRCYTGRYIRLCRQLYEIYPQIRKSLISKFGRLKIRKSPISALPANFEVNDSQIVPTVSTQLTASGDKLIEWLTWGWRKWLINGSNGSFKDMNILETLYLNGKLYDLLSK